MNSSLKKTGAGYFFGRPIYQGKKLPAPFLCPILAGKKSITDINIYG